MKKILTLAVFSALISGCGNKKNESGFELKGTLTDTKGETIYLEKFTSQKPVVVDSSEIDENGNFSFNNFTPNIGFYRVKLNDQNFAMMVLDSADKITVTGSAKDLGNTYKVEGSPETKLFLEYNELAKAVRMRQDSLQEAARSAMYSVKVDSVRMDSLSKTFEGVYNRIIDEYCSKVADKIKANCTMFASIMPIQPLDPDKYSDIYKALDEGLTKKYPQSKDVKTFHSVVQRALSAQTGGEAPEINLPSPEGKNIALSSLRGKIVLIDFWASWCGPCRKEMPNVKAAYEKFKSKGFEIYGVSLDKDMNDWVDAIKKDGITWPQVSDLQYWNSEAARAYNVQGIPYTVLLDKEGKILAKGLRGAELETKLAELLGK